MDPTLGVDVAFWSQGSYSLATRVRDICDAIVPVMHSGLPKTARDLTMSGISWNEGSDSAVEIMLC